MAFDKGFDFRQTSGFVTDPANCTYVLSGDTYPVTRNGVTFGWTGSLTFMSDRDRNSGIDPRLAGLNVDGFENAVFQIDLPASGTYLISLAGGDASNPGKCDVTFKDGGTTLFNVSDLALANGFFLDAVGNSYDAATWPGSNTPKLVTLAGSTLTMLLTNISLSNQIVHIFVSQSAPPASGNPWSTYAQMRRQ